MKCSKRKKSGDPCGAQAVDGTDACIRHAGRPAAEHKAKGAVVVEVSRWGLGDETLDPGITLLRLMTQSVRRAELYGQLLEEAYDAAERLRAADSMGEELPPNADTGADRDRAAQDLARVFATGGVAALIGHTYAADKEGGVFATGEAIRGLVTLEAQERDRAAAMATKAVAAGLAERQVQLAERQGQLVAEVIRGVLSDLGLDVADPGVVRVVSARLRALGEAA
ncbi:hypothetical protein [Geodermatophilus chilensis]|uniref:hypothetical protein n=1 Tax=Geodermatophilus chilensis TaxID=2035835 RepID=UPI000C257E2E|nr:hypothetical protein [Geodermatophilus chilensis]